MSLKSRLRSKRRSEKQKCDPVEEKRGVIKISASYYLLVTILLLSFLVMFLILWFDKDKANDNQLNLIAVITIFLNFILIIFSTFYLSQSVLVCSMMKRIRFSSEQSLVVMCKGVRFLTRPYSRNSFEVVCLILSDAEGEKYYYPTRLGYSAKKDLKKSLIGSELTLICYKDTNVIKRIDEERNLK